MTKSINQKVKKPLSLTVVISTRRAPQSLKKTVKSIQASQDISNFELIVVADGLSKAMSHFLERHKVKSLLMDGKHTLAFKYKQALNICKSDLIVFTQDDVLFDSECLSQIVQEFTDSQKVTMVCSHVTPLAPESHIEKALVASNRIIYRIATHWKNGKNYLIVNGRCMSFRTNFVKKYKFPTKVVNLDTFFFFENRMHKGVFSYLPKAIVYNRIPATLQEHLQQSSRFQASFDEVSRLVKNVKYKEDYVIPKRLALHYLILEFISNPLYTSLYILTLIYTRLFRLEKKSSLNPLWLPDMSTKNL